MRRLIVKIKSIFCEACRKFEGTSCKQAHRDHKDQLSYVQHLRGVALVELSRPAYNYRHSAGDLICGRLVRIQHTKVIDVGGNKYSIEENRYALLPDDLHGIDVFNTGRGIPILAYEVDPYHLSVITTTIDSKFKEI